MKYLIVNADDFGISEKTNTGIIKAYKNGILTSTSIMANMHAFNHAIKLAKKNKKLGIGVHLNLSVGEPLAVDSELSKRGMFDKKNLVKAIRGKLNPRIVEREFTEQIGRVMDKGINITHLDGHKHIHVMPNVRKVVVKLAHEFGIKAVRVPFESYSDVASMFSKNNLKKHIVNYNAIRARKLWIRYGLLCPHNFLE